MEIADIVETVSWEHPYIMSNKMFQMSLSNSNA